MVGACLVLIFNLLGAAQEVYFGHFLQEQDPTVVTVLSVSLCIVVYNLLNFRQLKNHWQKVRKEKIWVVALNITTLMSWVGFFFSLKYIEPAVASMLGFAVSPFFTFLGLKLTGRHYEQQSALDWFISLGILASMGALVYLNFSGASAVGSLSTKAALLGTFYSLLAGLGIAGNTVFSKKLSDQGFDPSNILSTRFYLIIPFALIFWPYGEGVQGSVGSMLLVLFPVTLVTMILPLYVLQKAIKLSRPTTVSSLLPMLPLMTFVLQKFDSRLSLSRASLLVITVTAVFCILGALLRLKKRPLIVAIVDGYSGGALYAPEIRRRGHQCVHVQSTPVIPESYAKAFFAQDYDHQLVYRGHLMATVFELKKLGVSRVMAGIETGVELADELSEAMGTLSNGSKLSPSRRDKYLMAQAVERAGQRIAKQFSSAKKEEILEWIKKEKIMPVVIKPPKSAGGDAVRICEDEKSALEACENILGKNNQLGILNSAVLAQEYLRGTEYVVNHVSFEGKHKVMLVLKYEKRVTSEKSFIYDRDLMVTPENEAYLPLVNYTQKVLDALEIQYGPSHAEIMLDEQGPVLVEIASRIDGVSHPPLEELCLGQSQRDMALEVYLTPEESQRKIGEGYQIKKEFAVVHLINQEDQKPLTATFVERLKGLASFYDYKLRFPVGAKLAKTVDLFTSPGFVFLTHEDREVLEQDYRFIRQWEGQSL